MKGVILAAGEGSRLQPITSTRPKHLIRIGGKPILEHCLNAVKSSGIDDVLIVVHYMADAIRQHFGDGSKLGLRIEYVEQKETVGTGNAVSIVHPHVKEDFVLVYGDLLFAPGIVKTVVDLHQKEKPSATMTVVSVERPENYGIVELESESKVKRIVEKPTREEAPSNLANAGIYAFSPEIFEKLKVVTASSRGEWEVTDALSLILEENKKVLAVRLSANDWFDIGRPWDLLEANLWIMKRMKHKVNGLVEINAHVIGPVTIAKSARIRSGTYIEGPAFIDEESDIGPNCYIRPCTSIGKKVRVGNACEIKNSIIMDGSHIGHLAYVGDSIVGEKCNLGAGTITANYRLDGKTIKMKVRDKVVDSERRKLGSVLGDNVKTGIGALLMPGVKIGANSWVGPNAMVERDLPANSAALLNQNVERKDLEA